MRPVVVRNIPIGEGRPKICVPIVGKTVTEILDSARQILSLPADVVEWRADHYDDVCKTDKLLDTARALREILGEKPILFTFRGNEFWIHKLQHMLIFIHHDHRAAKNTYLGCGKTGAIGVG